MPQLSLWNKQLHKQHSLVHKSFIYLTRWGPKQNGYHFAEDIFKGIFLNEYVCILIQISMKFDSKGLIDSNSSLADLLALCNTDGKPLPAPKGDPVMLIHVYVTKYMSWRLIEYLDKITRLNLFIVA